MRQECTSYCIRVNALIADAQMQAEYFSELLAGVSVNAYSLHKNDVNNEEENGGCTTRPGTEGDDVEVVASLAGPL